MQFYNRYSELNKLQELDQRADKEGVLTVLTGRRRVGKTVLALHYAQDKKFLYLFVSRKEESILCQEFLEDIKKGFDIPIIGEIKYFKDIFLLILEIAKKEKLTVIFDEFQEFFYVNATVYADIQKLWDLHKHTVRLHVIFIGSIYSLMHQIFENNRQPLFGRANSIMAIKPFTLQTLRNILEENVLLQAETYFNYYTLTGGIPKYLDIFLYKKAQNFDDMLDIILHKDSLFLNEGKNLLIEEFGRDYLMYFTILELISQGKTARGELESLLAKDIGGYLHRLEQDYGVINRHRSIEAKPQTRNQKYKIIDNFLNFWFRFIYRHRTALEIENFDYVKHIIKRDYTTYAGTILERFFQQAMSETGQFNHIGAYWERGHQNEIDVVAINEIEHTILIAEVKFNNAKINLDYLKAKSQNLLKHYPQFKPKFLGWSIQDILTLET